MLIDEWMEHTEGTVKEKRVKLREFIFMQNTGRWPGHLRDRKWMEGEDGENTWRYA